MPHYSKQEFTPAESGIFDTVALTQTCALYGVVRTGIGHARFVCLRSADVSRAGDPSMSHNKTVLIKLVIPPWHVILLLHTCPEAKSRQHLSIYSQPNMSIMVPFGAF